MNTKFSIKNFRVFDENGVKIELAPITILTGKNSAGKSSIVKAITLLDSFLKQVKWAKSRGEENTPEKIKRFQGEINTFKDRWQDFLDEGDPYYNVNLSLDTEQYHIKKCKVNYKD